MCDTLLVHFPRVVIEVVVRAVVPQLVALGGASQAPGLPHAVVQAAAADALAAAVLVEPAVARGAHAGAGLAARVQRGAVRHEGHGTVVVIRGVRADERMVAAVAHSMTLPI